jgi:aminoglycoside 2''-phosphotransferase
MRQGSVDLAALVARIRAEFPDLAFARAKLNDLGEDHAVVFLDEAWVFRFPRNAEVAAHAAMERRLLEALQPVSPIAVPAYDHVSRAGDFGGYRMIAGQELSEALFASLGPAAQARVLDELGRFLSALTPAQLADADRFYEALPAAVICSERALTHRDLTEDHILLDDSGDRLAGVIDFTDAALGDPAFDFTFLWAYGDDAPARVARSYGDDQTVAGILTRSHWWFARYRLDQIWWSLNGDREYDVAAIARGLPALFESLEV